MQIRFNFACSFWLLNSFPDDTNQQISLKAQLVETSSIWKFEENFQFCNKVWSSWEFLQNWVKLLTFTINSSVEIRDSYFDERFQLQHTLWASISTQGFHSCSGSQPALQALIQVLGELWTSSKVFDCFGLCLWVLTRAQSFPAHLGRCHQHWLVSAGTVGGHRHWLLAGAWTGHGLTISSSLLACSDLLSMNSVIPLYIYCSYSTAELCRQQLLQQGIGLVLWLSMSGWSRVLANQTTITHFYVIITLLLLVMTVIIALLLHIFTQTLSHINTPVITSLLPVVTLIMGHYCLLLL